MSRSSDAIDTVLDCGVCRLRRWRADDRNSLVRNADHRAVWINLRDRFPHPYTAAAADEWIAFASTHDPLLHFAIEVDGEAAGGIGFEPSHDVERVGMEIGYWLGPGHWGRGIMSAAVRFATAHAFDTYTGITRIFAVPFARNTPSIRLLEKTGYRMEGVMRRSALKDGEVLDQLMMAITDLDHAEMNR